MLSFLYQRRGHRHELIRTATSLTWQLGGSTRNATKKTVELPTQRGEHKNDILRITLHNRKNPDLCAHIVDPTNAKINISSMFAAGMCCMAKQRRREHTTETKGERRQTQKKNWKDRENAALISGKIKGT